MKKIVLMMLVILVGLRVQAQVGPCVTYKANRSLAEFKQLVLSGNDPFIRNSLWPEYARICNRALQSSKNAQTRSINITSDYNGMQWLMSNTKLYDASFFDPANYRNAGRSGSSLVWTNLPGLASSWAVLDYDDVQEGYAKIACLNAEDNKYPKSFSPPPSNPMAKAATKEKEEIAFVVLSQTPSCNHGGTFVQRQPSNTMVMVNLSINAMGGGRYNYGTPAVVAPNRQWYPQSGGPVGVPGFPANTGGPWGVNGFPANVSSGVPWDANGFPATGGNPVSPYGFGSGGPVGIGGFPAQSNWD